MRHQHADPYTDFDQHTHTNTHGDTHKNPDANRDCVSIANALTDADIHNPRAAQGISADNHPFELIRGYMQRSASHFDALLRQLCLRCSCPPSAALPADVPSAPDRAQPPTTAVLPPLAKHSQAASFIL